MSFEITYQPFGEKAILISWPQVIDNDVLQDIVLVKKMIVNSEGFLLLDVTNGYNSLLLVYKQPFEISLKIKQLKKIVTSRKQNNSELKNSKWVVPVCYHESFGIDIQSLASSKNMSIDEVIHLHTEQDYKVFCKGFLPGFMYLGGLDPKLYISRKATPRLRVPKNSVAIGGKQTGVYPCESPGGWQIIGRTPITLFDVNNIKTSLIKLGDTIRFQEISLKEYMLMESENLKLIQDIEY